MPYGFRLGSIVSSIVGAHTQSDDLKILSENKPLHQNYSYLKVFIFPSEACYFLKWHQQLDLQTLLSDSQFLGCSISVQLR